MGHVARITIVFRYLPHMAYSLQMYQTRARQIYHHIWQLNALQSSALISRPNKALYCIQHCSDWDITWSEVGPQNTPHTSPSWANYGVSFVSIGVKIDRVITASYCIFQKMVQEMSETQMRELLQMAALRAPPMMWDLLTTHRRLGTPAPPEHDDVDDDLSWCVCQHCRPMPTKQERKCCRFKPEHCLSRRHVSGKPKMRVLC